MKAWNEAKNEKKIGKEKRREEAEKAVELELEALKKIE